MIRVIYVNIIGRLARISLLEAAVIFGLFVCNPAECVTCDSGQSVSLEVTNSDVHLLETAFEYIEESQRWRFAINVLLGTQNENVQSKLLDYFFQCSHHSKETLSIVADNVSDFRSKVNSQSIIYKKATLLQARLFLQLENIGESTQLFSHAIHNGWPDAVQCYLESIRDVMGETTSTMVSHYLLPIARRDLISINDSSSVVSTKESSGLTRFFRSMTIEKEIDVPRSAMRTVYPLCIPDRHDPMTRQIAEIACLTTDKQYKKALELLIKLDPVLAPDFDGDNTDSPVTSPELKNTPFYYIIIQSLRGGVTDSIDRYIKLFIQRNPDNRDFVRERLALIMYFLNTAGAEGGKTITALADLMIENGFASDDFHRNTEVFGCTTWRNHIYDMKLVGTIIQKKYDKSFVMASEFLENYKGDDLACNNAVYLLGTIYSNHYNNGSSQESVHEFGFGKVTHTMV